MKTLKTTLRQISPANEKERLEIMEKKVEIQMKRMEIRKERMSMSKMVVEKEKEQLELEEKKLAILKQEIENKQASLNFETAKRKSDNDNYSILGSKIFTLLFTLESKVIDDEKTIIGSEPYYESLIQGRNKDIVLNKLMELIQKL